MNRSHHGWHDGTEDSSVSLSESPDSKSSGLRSRARHAGMHKQVSKTRAEHTRIKPMFEPNEITRKSNSRIESGSEVGYEVNSDQQDGYLEDDVRSSTSSQSLSPEAEIHNMYKWHRPNPDWENMGEAHRKHQDRLNRDHKSEGRRLSMYRLLDNAGQYLADASSDATPMSSGNSLSEEYLTAEEESVPVNHDALEPQSNSEASSQSRNKKIQGHLALEDIPYESYKVEIWTKSQGWHISSLPAPEDEEESLQCSPSVAVQSRSRTEEIDDTSVFSDATMKLHSDLVYPPSKYRIPPPLLVSQERDVMSEFSKNARRNRALDKEDDFLDYELSDFFIYVQGHVEYLGYELVSLNNLGNRSLSTLLFDGVLSNGTTRRYVEGVPFERCPIGNYGEDVHQVGEEIWIQSNLNSSKEVYYRLKEPAPEYQRFHTGFLWLADLAKYFVDYLHCLDDQDELATLLHFQTKFMDYLISRHGDEQCFQNWHGQYKSEDFRSAINAHIDFLFRQAMGVDRGLEKHTIWSEVLDYTAVPEQKQVEEKTIVTPYVYECFKGMPYGHWLKPQSPVAKVAKMRKSRENELQMPVAAIGTGLLEPVFPPNSSSKTTNRDRNPKGLLGRYSEKISVGDVLGIFADSAESRQWKTEDEVWYAYITNVRKSPSGRQILKVIWLYKPADTICGDGVYPFKNELFMSGHCECKRDVELDENDVHSKVTVAFHGSPNECDKDFFVRSTYIEEEHSFVTFKDSHKSCSCVHPRTSKTPFEEAVDTYKIGDTVLVVVPNPGDPSEDRLDPCEIAGFLRHPINRILLRRLCRRSEIDAEGHSPPNELIYTDDLFETKAEDIERRCLVRFYTTGDRIPAPYNRNGTGDAFFITSRLKGLSSQEIGSPEAKHRLIPIDHEKPETFIEGFDPNSKPVSAQLRGLDLFCGGGSLGRGISEGGAVTNLWAVDLNKHAIHTYAANQETGANTLLYRGSVDDMLSQAMENNPKNSRLIPLPGDVEFLSAGNPCVAYSRLNSKKGTEQGLKNQSFIASVASYVDFYRPTYGFLENVVTCPIRQLVCTLVGIGYQVQLFRIDAWSCGSPQSRSRLIVSIAAPGRKLPAYPALSHSHPESREDVGLGKAANGEKFGLRRSGPTPFRFVTAAQATQDLPNIGDAQAKMCIPFPDHVVARLCLSQIREQIKIIPKYPRGMNFYKAFSAGREGNRVVNPEALLMTDAESKLFGNSHTKKDTLREAFRKGSKAYGRMNPDTVFPCIVCILALPCSRTGTCIHWEEPRIGTIMEARRAQDVPDHEVLIGPRPAQYKIIGNSVPRSVALALGLSLRDPWLAEARIQSVVPHNTSGLQEHVDLSSDNELAQHHSQSSMRSSKGRSSASAVIYRPNSIIKKQKRSMPRSIDLTSDAENDRPNNSKKQRLSMGTLIDLTLEAEESPTSNSQTSSVEGAFESLLEAIKADKPDRFPSNEQVRLIKDNYEVIIRRRNHETHETDSPTDENDNV